MTHQSHFASPYPLVNNRFATPPQYATDTWPASRLRSAGSWDAKSFLIQKRKASSTTPRPMACALTNDALRTRFRILWTCMCRDIVPRYRIACCGVPKITFIGMNRRHPPSYITARSRRLQLIGVMPWNTVDLMDVSRKRS